MPKKSVREMTGLERMRHSLSSRIFRFVLLGSVLLGIVCLVIGLSLYTVAVARQDISTAFLFVAQRLCRFIQGGGHRTAFP